MFIKGSGLYLLNNYDKLCYYIPENQSPALNSTLHINASINFTKIMQPTAV